MGPRLDAGGRRFELRPFPTSQTYRNLKAHGEGVLHVTDDVLLLARAALGAVEPLPPLMPATSVRGFVLRDWIRKAEQARGSSITGGIAPPPPSLVP